MESWIQNLHIITSTYNLHYHTVINYRYKTYQHTNILMVIRTRGSKLTYSHDRSWSWKLPNRVSSRRGAPCYAWYRKHRGHHILGASTARVGHYQSINQSIDQIYWPVSAFQSIYRYIDICGVEGSQVLRGTDCWRELIFLSVLFILTYQRSLLQLGIHVFIHNLNPRNVHI